jgi:hypothetical protein
MEQTTYTTRVLIPTKGFKITQADDATPLQERIFSDKIYLAVNDSPDNYKEITLAQAEELQRQQQAEIEEQTKNVEP